MKVAQTECEKLVTATKAAGTAAAAAATQKHTQSAASTLAAAAAVSLKNNENVCSNNAAAASKATSKMTDERSSDSKSSSDSDSSPKNTNNNINNNNNNNNNEHLIAEAAKIFFKNGLNGTSAAATATLLSSVPTTATFALPVPQPAALQFSAPLPSRSVSDVASTVVSSKSPAGAASASVNAGCRSRLHPLAKSVSNGLSSTETTTPTARATQFRAPRTATETAMAAATASATPPVAHHAGVGSTADVKTDNGVIDYTINHTPSSSSSSSTVAGTNSNQKFTTHVNSNNGGSGSGSGGNSSSDIGRHLLSTAGGSNNSTASGYGGRLQFFKEGKVILELQRSKDGEKGGWVSVPRKIFRSPAATSSTVTPTSAPCAAYPKNESSTSLSFSDDNSSIQSSPWQRDHCWKQSAPRRGISKEMSMCYRRPKGLELSRNGLQLARRKRRKPQDITVEEDTATAFQHSVKAETVIADKEATQPPSRALKKSETVKENADDDHSRIDDNVSSSSSSSSSSSLSSTATLTGADCTDAAVASENSTMDKGMADMEIKKEVESDTIKANADDVDINVCAEKMYTSEDDDMMGIEREGKSRMPDVNGSSDAKNLEVNSIKIENSSAEGDETLSSADADVVAASMQTEEKGDKRLNVPKTRAKLNTIIKKLNDSVPVRTTQSTTKTFPLLPTSGVRKTGAKLTTIIQKLIDSAPARTTQTATKGFPLLPPGGSCGLLTNHQGGASNAQSHKVSSVATPSAPATSSASRLVEYHQQHVSPRKRILRQFEKVSLEDNAAAAGGKRSRAKGTMSASTQPHQLLNAKSSPNRNQSNSGSTTLQTTIHALASNGSQQSVTGSKSKGPSTATATSGASSAAPRLYSSYSIHSLLGGGSDSSSSSASPSKKSNDAAIVSSSLSYQHPQLYADPSYLRTMLASPQSPESQSGISCGGGGKSPSNLASSKKRSPPYASAMHEAHSRSPTMAHAVGPDYGRRSPRATTPLDTPGGAASASSYKLRYGMDHGLSSPTPNHPQSFYPPYMMSPKYVSAANHHHQSQNHYPSSAISPNTQRPSSAFSSTPSSAAGLSVSASTTYIPQAGVASHAPREMSPSRSSTASPRESTPRTVPKKTASIRRQFASPTTASANNSCSSPSDRTVVCEDTTASPQERKTPVASVPPHLLQRGSPLAMAAMPLNSSLQYYMYPPHASGGSPSSHSSVSAPPAVNPAAAAAAAYIPSVVSPSFFPYISTLAPLRHNPMWLHHYPGGVPGVLSPHHSAASSPSARLSPPFHAFPPYNGVGVSAAAVAAAHHHMLSPAATLHGSGGGGSVGGAFGVPSPKTTDNSADHLSTAAAKNAALRTPSGAASAALYPSGSIKDELSSDVPLNLSKH